jgi:hypothetical protein
MGFIVTNTQLANRKVLHFYNQRGKAEQGIKEGKQAVKMTRLSCNRFRSNDVRLWLSILAYNLGNLWRRLTLPAGISDWSLTGLQQDLVKTGGRLVKHGAVLLDDAGRRTPHANPVLSNVAKDRAVAAYGKLNGRRQRRQSESRKAKEDG